MTTGAHFRYQTEDASYHYNLKTTGLTTGTWQLNFRDLRGRRNAQRALRRPLRNRTQKHARSLVAWWVASGHPPTR